MLFQLPTTYELVDQPACYAEQGTRYEFVRVDMDGRPIAIMCKPGDPLQVTRASTSDDWVRVALEQIEVQLLQPHAALSEHWCKGADVCIQYLWSLRRWNAQTSKAQP